MLGGVAGQATARSMLPMLLLSSPPVAPGVGSQRKVLTRVGLGKKDKLEKALGTLQSQESK